MSDPYADWDAAYVLGSLSPAERRDYERHLTGCPECAHAVSELAGIPGLLARVPAEQVSGPAESPPPSLLPRLGARVAHDRRRRRWLTGALATAAAACVAIALVVGWSAARPDTAAPVAQRQMSVLVPAPVHATAGLQSVTWGTRITMRCTHDAPPGRAYPPGAYTLVVVPRTGSPEQLASWTSVPGKTVPIEGDTSLTRAQIAAVEVHTARGLTVLRLAV